MATSGTEMTMVVLQVTNMGGAHYMLNGGAYRWDGSAKIGDVVAILGSAEIDAENPSDVQVVATIYHAEILGSPDRIEKFGGRMVVDYDTLDGSVVGLSTICPDPLVARDPATDCEWMTTGAIQLASTTCP